MFPSENYSEIEGCSDRDNYHLQYHPSESSDLHDLEPMSVQHGGHYPAYSQRGSSNISSAAPLQEIRGNGGETDHMIMSHQLNKKHYSQNCATKGKRPNMDKSKWATVLELMLMPEELTEWAEHLCGLTGAVARNTSTLQLEDLQLTWNIIIVSWSMGLGARVVSFWGSLF